MRIFSELKLKTVIIIYMTTRPSPSNSATLYKIGTKKKGNDGNIWIVTINTNGVKRWKLFKKPTKIKKSSSRKTSRKISRSKSRHKSRNKSRKTSNKSSKKTSNKSSKKKPKNDSAVTTFLLKFYDIPKIKPNNWSKWLEKLSKTNVELINKLRNDVVPKIKKLGIKVFIVPLPISKKQIYFIDYPWDYVERREPNLFDDNIPTIIIVIKIDKDLHLDLTEQKMLAFQHINIDKTVKKSFIELMTKEFGNKFEWNGSSKKAIMIHLS